MKAITKGSNSPDGKQGIQWTVNLVIPDGHFNPPQCWCGYVWVIITLVILKGMDSSSI